MLNDPRSGPNNVAEYMVSAIPFVTCSTLSAATIVEVKFPYVTRFFTIKNGTNTALSSSMSVGFTSRGLNAASGGHYFTLESGESFSGELRCKSLFLSSAFSTPKYEIIAGLTRVKEYMFPILTGSVDGSGSFEGVG